MKKANLHEAKTNLSKLVELAADEEEVIIETPKRKRKPGAWTGKVTIEKYFDILPEEFFNYFHKAHNN